MRKSISSGAVGLLLVDATVPVEHQQCIRVDNRLDATAEVQDNLMFCDGAARHLS